MHSTFIARLVAETGDSNTNFVELNVHAWQWAVLLGIIVVLLLLDLLVFHRGPAKVLIHLLS